MKLCKDCKHVLPGRFSGRIDNDARCAKMPEKIHPVTGSPVSGFAEVARDNPFYCGETARWFEERSA